MQFHSACFDYYVGKFTKSKRTRQNNQIHNVLQQKPNSADELKFE